MRHLPAGPLSSNSNLFDNSTSTRTLAEVYLPVTMVQDLKGTQIMLDASN